MSVNLRSVSRARARALTLTTLPRSYSFADLVRCISTTGLSSGIGLVSESLERDQLAHPCYWSLHRSARHDRAYLTLMACLLRLVCCTLRLLVRCFLRLWLR